VERIIREAGGPMAAATRPEQQTQGIRPEIALLLLFLLALLVYNYFNTGV